MQNSEAGFNSPRLSPKRSWVSLLGLWNWKSAMLSMLLRVPVFAAVSIQKGLDAVAGAALTEAVICAVYAGCYAGIVQAIRNRRPLWLTALVITVVLPGIGQLIEYQVHTWRGTPHRIFAVMVSSILSILSSLFNWYAMRHGTLLVGNERSSLISDLRRFPLLVGKFLLLAPRWLLHRMGWSVLPST